MRREIVAATGKSMLVEAAAGTGKTTLIVGRVLQGLRDGSFTLPRAVAITFTEKAAGELQTRIREGLARALHEPGVSPQEAERLRTAAGELDRANISTIHAFCARLLREKSAEAVSAGYEAVSAGYDAVGAVRPPVSAGHAAVVPVHPPVGVDPEFSVLEPAQAVILRGRCWRDWMDGQVAECPEALVEALRAGVSVETLRALAFALANAPEVLEGERFAAAAPAKGRDEAVAALRELAPACAQVLSGYKKARQNDHWRALSRAAEKIAAAPAKDDGTVRRAAYEAAAASVDEALKSVKDEGKGEAGQALCAFAAAAGAVGAHLAADVLTWAAGFVSYYGAQRLARSAVDFQDLLLLTARMLRDRPSVRRYFRGRFDAFFVDEFQDTDPLQAELIAYLCEAPTGSPAAGMEGVRLAEGKLFAVGDPKQSIYRFRRADVQIYDRFKGLFGEGTFGEDRTRQIYCNFRSAEPLLRWFNRLFEVLLRAPAAAGVYQAPHVALEAPAPVMRPAAPVMRPAAPVMRPAAPAVSSATPTVLALCPPAGLPTGEWSVAEARRHEAHCIAYAIRKAVDGELVTGQDAWRYADFALLMRALTDADIYEDALERYGVPYRVVGGKHFYRREQTAETLTVLQAVDDPLDEAAVVGALRSTFFGFSDEDLLRYRMQGGEWNYLREDEFRGPVGAGLKTLAGWHRRRNRVAPQALLREVFDATKAPQAFLLKPAGVQRVANLEKLLNDLRGLGAAAGSFGAVVRYLTEVREAEVPEEESGGLEPGDDFVRIMSMHKAKGLEFGAVVLPDLARESRNEPGPLLFNRLDGRVGLKVAGGVQTASYAQLAEEEKGNEEAEQRRLFYVACTRARRLLALPLYWHRTTKPCFQQLLADSGCLAGPDDVPYGQERDGVHYVDTRGWAGARDAGAGPPARSQQEEGGAEELVAERERWRESHALLVRRASAGEVFVLPSAMEAGFEPRAPGEETAGGGGRDFGSLFHNLMAAVPAGAAPDGEAQNLVMNLAAMEAAGMGLPETAGEEAGELATKALRNAEFRALLDGAESVAREVTFAVPLGRLSVCAEDTPGLLEGSMDLLVRRGGRTTILDYKTDRFARRERKAVEERYWPQLALYGMAARACGLAPGEVELALFFPRAGVISWRLLDRELMDLVAARVREAVAEAAK